MKKILAGLLTATMLVTALAGCGGSSTSKTEESQSQASDTSSKAESKDADTSSKASDSDDPFAGRSDISYVMIYNPDVFEETSNNNQKMTTGDFSNFIDPDMKRADGLGEISSPNTVDQGKLDKLLGDFSGDFSGDRAGIMIPTHKVGEKKDYYYCPDLTDENAKNVLGKFECQYAGDKCYVWTLQGENVDKTLLEKVAKEFDTNIYQKDVEMFGTPRYADQGGKVSLLFHNMGAYIEGYFSPLDLFSSLEATEAEAEQYGLNLNEAIVHINTSVLNTNDLYATVAHEFQHLINESDKFELGRPLKTDTWFNEAMSGYAEEKIYPGIQKEAKRYDSLSGSDLIRNGQSLYNFETNTSSTPIDIGVYGSVFLYSMYMEKLAGTDFFKNVHDYWRTSYSPTLDTAEAIYKSVPADKVSSIDGKYSFDGASFKTDAQEWMSKMTLDFYISMLKYDSDDPDAFKDLDAMTLLYDQVNPAQIEGGGRVIVSTKDGTFEIPSDAGKPLVYVGFDKDFNVVTDIVVK